MFSPVRVARLRGIYICGPGLRLSSCVLTGAATGDKEEGGDWRARRRPPASLVSRGKETGDGVVGGGA